MTLTTTERAELERLRAASRTGRGAALVREAATNFINPDDAAAILDRSGDLATIETASEARLAVTDLARRKPHLTGAQPRSAGPTPAAGVLSRAELIALSKPQIDQMKRTNPSLYERSVNVSILGLAPDGRPPR